MNRRCQRIQDILAEVGAPGLSDDDSARQHVAECDQCFAALEALSELDGALATLPEIDAADLLVERLLVDVEKERTGRVLETANKRRFEFLGSPIGRWIGPIRRAVVEALTSRRVLATIATAGLALVVARAGFQHQLDSGGRGTGTQLQAWGELPTESGRVMVRGHEVVPAGEQLNRQRALGTVGLEPIAPAEEAKRIEPGPGQRLEELRNDLRDAAAERELEDRLSSRLVSLDQPVAKKKEITEELTVIAEAPRLDSTLAASAMMFDGESLAEADRDQPHDESANGSVGAGNRRSAPNGGGESGLDRTSDLTVDDLMFPADSNHPLPPSQPSPRSGGLEKEQSHWVGTSAEISFRKRDLYPTGRAQEFLRERDRVEGLVLREPRGYWSNAYVPGDPVFRLLQSRLEVEVEGGSGTEVVLHHEAQQVSQPFDSPVDSALDLFLQADRKRVRGETRTLVQVGIRATDKESGSRSPLAIALVLDLEDELSPRNEAVFRALVAALADQRDLGDRFSLVVAGRPGGVIVPAEQFRHGVLTVAMQDLFGVGGSVKGTLGLAEALHEASELVSQPDRSSVARPFGSSVVLVATARRLGATVSGELNTIAHQSALDGAPVSVIGIGTDFDRRELDLLTLAGQGNRRYLETAKEAAELIERELLAVSRVVARAVRVEIRLAPGVGLVDVIGSQRLESSSAEEVREVERMIDGALARHFGIEADRGEDDHGIQIFIPTFSAGDSHVILLDLVAPGPGPLVDASLRYKDLVFLRNGSASDHLDIGGGEELAGSLEVNVLKNLLAFRLYEALESAGRLLAIGETRGAIDELASLAELLEGLRLEMPLLARDPDLANDLELLSRYQALFESVDGESDSLRSRVVDSVRYAARLKILPQPVASRAWE